MARQSAERSASQSRAKDVHREILREIHSAQLEHVGRSDGLSRDVGVSARVYQKQSRNWNGDKKRREQYSLLLVELGQVVDDTSHRNPVV